MEIKPSFFLKEDQIGGAAMILDKNVQMSQTSKIFIILAHTVYIDNENIPSTIMRIAVDNSEYQKHRCTEFCA